MTLHSTLTGTDLHESKGVAAAAANTVAVADGSGSTAWKAVPSAALDTSTIHNINQIALCGMVDDISGVTPGQNNKTCYIPVPKNCTIARIDLVIGFTPTAGSVTMTYVNQGIGSMGAKQWSPSDTAGTTVSIFPSANNAIAAGSWIKFTLAQGSPILNFGGDTAQMIPVYITMLCALT